MENSMENSMNSQDLQNEALDWDAVIEDDGQEFVVLPEGDYKFRITGMKRGEFPGSAKLPACNKAVLTAMVEYEKPAMVTFDILMCRTLEWRIASFFRCIGQKKSGEKLKMDWNKVVGSSGRAHFRPRSYMKDGREHQVNDVVRFYDYDPTDFMTGVNDAELPWNSTDWK